MAQNSREPPTKISNVDATMNKIIKNIIVLQVLLSLLSVGAMELWIYVNTDAKGLDFADWWYISPMGKNPVSICECTLTGTRAQPHFPPSPLISHVDRRIGGPTNADVERVTALHSLCLLPLWPQTTSPSTSRTSSHSLLWWVRNNTRARARTHTRAVCLMAPHLRIRGPSRHDVPRMLLGLLWPHVP